MGKGEFGAREGVAIAHGIGSAVLGVFGMGSLAPVIGGLEDQVLDATVGPEEEEEELTAKPVYTTEAGYPPEPGRHAPPRRPEPRPRGRAMDDDELLEENNNTGIVRPDIVPEPPDPPERREPARSRAHFKSGRRPPQARFELDGPVTVRKLRPSEAMGLPEPPPPEPDDEAITRAFLKQVGWTPAQIEDIVDGPPFHLGDGNYKVRVRSEAQSAHEVDDHG